MTAHADPPQSSGDAEMIACIRANAGFVVEALAPQAEFPFAFDGPSVEWLDGYINRIRTGNWREEQIDQLVSNFGSYLGQAILALHGGAWARDEHGWHIRFDEGNRAYPFAKVAKQWQNGAEDSIFSFYSAIGVVFGKEPRL